MPRNRIPSQVREKTALRPSDSRDPQAGLAVAIQAGGVPSPATLPCAPKVPPSTVNGPNVTALLALEGRVVEPADNRLQLRKQHAVMPAVRAAGPVDPGQLGSGEWLKFGHGMSRDGRTDDRSPLVRTGSQNDLPGAISGGQNGSKLKT